MFFFSSYFIVTLLFVFLFLAVNILFLLSANSADTTTPGGQNDPAVNAVFVIVVVILGRHKSG